MLYLNYFSSNDIDSKKYKYPRIPAPYIEGLPETYGRFQWFKKKAIPLTTQIIESNNPDNMPVDEPIKGDEPLDEKDVRQAFVKYASSHMCYGKDCASNCFIEILNSSTSARVIEYL